MFVSKEELKTHLYSENINVIGRGDDTILQAAIDGAIQEAYGYLGDFDREAIFNAAGENRNALLLIFVKDLSVWHFLVLCNAGVELELREARYKRAVDWLKAVQRRDVSPNLPKGTDDNGDQIGGIEFGSNTKRNQHF